MLTIAISIGVLLNPPALLRADVTISGGTVGGPQSGDGGTFTVTSTGEIRSGGEGIVATGTDILALSVYGLVDAYSNGLNINTGGSLPSIGVTGTGTIGGGNIAVLNSGTVGSLTSVTGAQITASGGTGIYNQGTFTGTILNGGTILGYGSALYNSATGQIADLTNTGTLTANYAVRNAGVITNLTNQAGGSLQGDGYGVAVESGGSIATLTNAGAISGYNGLESVGDITTLDNSGTITAGFQGIRFHSASSLGTFTNSGTVSGGTYGMTAQAGSAIGTITNSGTFSGYNAYESSKATGTIRNLATGTFSGSSRGLGQYAPLTLLENAGTITANLAVITTDDVGTIDNQAGGLISGGDRGLQLTGITNTITTILNAGTIQGNIAIENHGNIGTIDNLAGGAITGGERAIATTNTITTILNAGTIQANIAIENIANITSLTNSSTINGSSQWGIWHRSGAIDTLTNTATGTISGAANAVRMDTAGTITLLSNSGTIAGFNAIESYGSITTLTNSGAITASGDWGIYTDNATIGTLTNAAAASITAPAHGLGFSNSTVGTISNAGLIAGTNGFGIILGNSTLTDLTNSGTITGGYMAIYADNDATIGSITNSGTIESGSHALALNTTGTITNTVTGLIRSTGGGHGIALLRDTSLIANAGTISGSAYGIFGAGGTPTDITNTGTIEGSRGIHSEGRLFDTITNSGIIQGTEHGMVLADTGTISNSATGVIRSTVDAAAIYLYGNNDIISNDGQISGASQGIFKSGGTLTTFTNTGSVSGATNGIENYGTIGTLTNSGSINGARDWGFYQGGNSIGTLTNTATGTITGTAHGMGIPYTTVGTIDNAGLISGSSGYGLYLEGSSLTNLANSGTISGGGRGIVAWGSSIGSITNSGTIEASDSALILNTTGTITNSATGIIRSTANASAIRLYGNNTSISNDGLISGVTEGIGQASGLTTTLTNTGRIEGGSTALSISGTTDKIINTGVIAYTGAGTGPALLVGPGGVLGDASGARGPSIESTGASALISGRIVNEGTIYHGFTIENQNVEVSAAGGTGTFTAGSLDVTDGNLSLLDGRINLGSDISVSGGAGSVFNESTLALYGARTIHGAFSQLNVGSLVSVFDGPTAATLLFDGVATFDGSFGLELGGFSFADGQSIDLLTYNAYSGGFSGFSVDGLALASAGAGRWSYSSFVLEEQWSATTMRITVTAAPPSSVPEPGTMSVATLLVGFGFAISRRRTPSRS